MSVQLDKPYHKLTPKERVRYGGRWKYRCLCVCGAVVFAQGSMLLKGSHRQCRKCADAETKAARVRWNGGTVER